MNVDLVAGEPVSDIDDNIIQLQHYECFDLIYKRRYPMSMVQQGSEISDRVELTLRTEATLTDAEKVQCEANIRKILDVEGIAIDSLVFREGSTIVAIGLLIAGGLVAKFIGGVLNKLGERTVDVFLPKPTEPSASTGEKPSIPPAPEKNIAVLGQEEAAVPYIDTQKQALGRVPAELAGQRIWMLVVDLPGKTRIVEMRIERVDPETNEFTEEYCYRKTTKP